MAAHGGKCSSEQDGNRMALEIEAQQSDMQCAVAKSDGVVSANERKVLDAFQKGLG